MTGLLGGHDEGNLTFGDLSGSGDSHGQWRQLSESLQGRNITKLAVAGDGQSASPQCLVRQLFHRGRHDPPYLRRAAWRKQAGRASLLGRAPLHARQHGWQNSISSHTHGRASIFRHLKHTSAEAKICARSLAAGNKQGCSSRSLAPNLSKFRRALSLTQARRFTKALLGQWGYAKSLYAQTYKIEKDVIWFLRRKH